LFCPKLVLWFFSAANRHGRMRCRCTCPSLGPLAFGWWRIQFRGAVSGGSPLFGVRRLSFFAPRGRSQSPTSIPPSSAPLHCSLYGRHVLFFVPSFNLFFFPLLIFFFFASSRTGYRRHSFPFFGSFTGQNPSPAGR